MTTAAAGAGRSDDENNLLRNPYGVMMTPAEKIQIAADMIHDALNKRGTEITPAECLAMARQLYNLWEDHQHVKDLPAGVIAQKFRERYEYDDKTRSMGLRDDAGFGNYQTEYGDCDGDSQ